MPDLMKTPSNRRYVVNFQQKEPLNKYDIWLSFNKHNLDGNIVIDSEYLSDKDLVFKVFVDGKWVPILGIPVSYEGIIQALEELDKKKMNIVPPIEWEDGHIPIFQQGPDECDQLIDGGTIEELVANALTTIINNGGTIPIQRATTTELGGVKAGLHIHNNNPDQYVEAKFKFPEGYSEGGIVENDRLYVSASEIIQAINTYIGGGGSGLDLQLMGPSTRGGAMANLVPVSWEANKYIPVLINQGNEHMYINGNDVLSVLEYILENDPLASIYEAGEGIDITDNVISIKTAEDNATGGVRARVNPTQNSRAGIEITFGNNDIADVLFGRTIDTKHLCFTRDQLAALWSYQDENMEPMFRNGYGTWVRYWHELNTHTGLYDDYITISLNYDDATDRDKFLKSKADGSGIEWVNIPVGTVYPPLTANSSVGDECVVVAPGPSGQNYFLRGDGVFAPVSAGDSFSITPILLSGTQIATYTLNGVSGSLYAPNSIYYGGEGISIGNGNRININTSAAHNGDVLSYNGTHVEWVPQTSYIAGYGILMTNGNKINSNVENNPNPYEVTSSIVFNCTIASASNPLSSIVMNIDNTTHTNLDPYTYTDVTLKMGTPIDITFNTQNQFNCMKGNPVYVMFDIEGKVAPITISVPSAFNKDWLINVNNAVIVNSGNSCLDTTNYSRFLCTLQFGTVKIEPLEATVSQNDNNNSQEEP